MNRLSALDVAYDASFYSNFTNKVCFLTFGSVSDLLDYINPSCDAKGRDIVALKRKSYITKVCGV